MKKKSILHSTRIIKKDRNSIYYESIPIYELSRYFIFNLVKHIYTPDDDIITMAIKHLNLKEKNSLLNYIKHHHPSPENLRYKRLEDDYEISMLLNEIENSNLKINFNQLKEILMEYLSNGIEEIFNKKILTPELNKLKKIFKLSYKEILVTVFIFLMEENEAFEDAIRFSNLNEFIRLLMLATEISMSEIKLILSRESRLIKSGIIESSSKRNINFSLNENLKYFLLGINNKGLEDNLYRIYNKSLFDVHDFNISKLDLEIITSIIKSDAKCNILFYGAPGTGKTELSKSIISYCGKRAIFPIHNDKVKLNDKMLAFEAAMGLAGKNDVIVIDEADQLLSSGFDDFPGYFGSNSANHNKAWINDFLDSSNKQNIWIVNNINYIDKSTARRFVYSLEFKTFTKKEREKAWKIVLKNINVKNIMSKKEIEIFSEKYPINMGSISFSLNVINSIKNYKTLTHKKLIQYLENLLASQTKLILGENPKQNEINQNIEYDLSIINANLDLRALIKDLKQFIHYKHSHRNSKIAGINLLFYGPPGTGKTEFAKYLSIKLNKELIPFRASDLMNLYVGETEKNISRAFKKAEAKDAILLIDEADSYFTERRNAVRSWEVSRTNEFLTQLENHSIIFIGCTNLIETFDSASIRRFHWKINFRPLTKEGKIKLYKKYFKLDGKKLTEKHKNRLIRIDPITPGDMKAVWQRTMYLHGKTLGHDFIIREIEKEIGIKKMKEPKKIGLL